MSIFSSCSFLDEEPTSKCQLDPRSAAPLEPVRSKSLTDGLSDESSSGCSPNSNTENRRHGIYFHRPPVWRAGPWQRNAPPPSDGLREFTGLCDDIMCNGFNCPRLSNLKENRLCSHCEKAEEASTVRCVSPDFTMMMEEDKTDNPVFDPIHKTAATIDARVDTEAGLSNLSGGADSFNWHGDIWDGWRHQPMMGPFTVDLITPSDSPSQKASTWNAPREIPRTTVRQSKAGLCTRLKSIKDVRVGIDEKWAVQERSLVMCIDPSYTRFDRKEGFPDEFELACGDAYIVCRLYADLWALCARISFDHRPGNYCHDRIAQGRNLGFLPLCAVTLAANFSAFVKRCSQYPATPTQASNPGNGLTVTPPERSHSVNASRQIFQGPGPCAKMPVALPVSLRDFLLEENENEFVPLDSTLHQLFSKLNGRRNRVHQLKHRVSARTLWRGIDSIKQHKEDFLLLMRSHSRLATSPRTRRGGSHKLDFYKSATH